MAIGSLGKIKKRYWVVGFLVMWVVGVWYVGANDPADLLEARYGATIGRETAGFSLATYIPWWPKRVVSVGMGEELDEEGMALLLKIRKLELLRLRQAPAMELFVSRLNEFRHLEDVRIDTTLRLGRGELAAMAELSESVKLRVKSLYVERLEEAPADGLDWIGRILTLRSLHLEGAGVDDVGLAGVGKAQMLQVLDLEEAAVTNEGLGALIGLKDFRSLGLLDVDVTDGAIEKIEQMEGLGLLKLRGTGITEAGLARLKESRPDIVVRKIQRVEGGLK